MKKTITIIATIILVAMLFAACGAPAPAASPAATPADASIPADASAEMSEDPAAPADGGGKLIGVSMPTKSLQRWNQDGENMKKALEAKGYTVDLQYAGDNEIPLQVSQLENMITKGCEVLVIASIDGEALTDVLKKAAESDISVIAYDRLIKNSPDVDYYATFDNYMVGQIQGNFIKDKLKLDTEEGPFNIEFFGGSADDNNAFVFNKGAMDVLQPFLDSGKLVNKSGQVDMDQISILGWKTESAQNRMDNLITANYTSEPLHAVLSPNDSLAQGIVTSLKSNGFEGDKFPVVTGQDCDVASVKSIVAGDQAMSVFKDTRMLAEKVVEMVDAIGKGQEPEINDTTSYDNGVKIVPSYLLEPEFCDLTNYKTLLVDSGYYTEDQLK